MSYIRIFVGLGGFGTSVVRELHSIVKKNNNGEIPDYVRFAAYDSATHEKPKVEDFPNAVDFMVASPDTPNDFLLQCKENYSDFDKWWPGIFLDKTEQKLWTTSDLQFTGRGLGQYRPFGRLGFFKHINDINDNIVDLVYRLFTDAAQALNVQVNAINPRIILINSLAGGTGSSSFLDIAFLLKERLGQITKPEFIFFTVTGDASMKGRTSKESDAYKWASANSYAALTELKYWMDVNKPAGQTVYPRYGTVNQTPPVFRHASILCQDNMKGKNLPKFSDYIQYLAECLYLIDVKKSSAQTFNSAFDNVLAQMKRFGSIGIGSIHYRYKDALLYLFSLFAEETLNSYVLRQCTDEVKKDIEKEIHEFYLEEESYYMGDINTLKPARKDDIMEFLGQSYTDERKLDNFFPEISLSALDAKLNYENLQSVSKGIENLDKQMHDFLNVKKREVYDKINQKIKSHIFYNPSKNAKVTLSYIHEYLTQIKTLVNARIKGLEQDIPSVFEEIHLKDKRNYYLNKKSQLEKRLSKKYLQEFRHAFKEYYETKKFVYKVKSKLEIYKNLVNQIDKYIIAVEAILKPTMGSLLKHYRSMQQGLQLGTYSLYKFDSFSIQVMPVYEFASEYGEIYENWKKSHAKISENLSSIINDKIVESMKDLPEEVGDLLESFQVEPYWAEDTYFDQQKIRYALNADKEEVVKQYLKGQLKDIMDGEFEHHISDYLPRNAVDALYKEAKLSGKQFVDFLNERRIDLNNLVEPFVVLKGASKDQVSTRAPLSTFIVGEDDVRNLFNKYADDQQLQKSINKVFDILGISGKSNHGGFAVEGHLEKMILVKQISGFEIEDLAAYTHEFKQKYQALTVNESFADIRLKPDQDINEVVFLLAEYFSIIESKEPHFKFENRTLDKGLKGRGNVITWFKLNRDKDKITRVRKALLKEWKKVSEADKADVFKKVVDQLMKKKQSVKDDGLFDILESNIHAMEHALDFKKYETIDKFLQ